MEVKRIPSLQAVRCLAFLSLFVFHCDLTGSGGWGVSLFLVLSGFLMIYNYFNRELTAAPLAGVRFGISKIKKLYPLHLLMLLAAILLDVNSLLRRFTLNRISRYLVKVLLHASLLQAWVPSSSVYFALNGVAWYLSVTLFLYCLFPFILAGIKKWTGRKTAVICIAAVYAAQLIVGALTKNIGNSNSDPAWITYIAPPFRLGDFVIGCALGYLYITRKKEPHFRMASVLEICSILLAVLTLFLRERVFSDAVWFRTSMLYTPASVFLIYVFAVNKGILTRLLTCRPVLYIGNISPYAYLIHQIVIKYCRRIWLHIFGTAMNPWLTLPVCFILTLLCTELYLRLEAYLKNRSARS